MRLLLISIFVIFLVGLLTPNVFGEQKSVLIHSGTTENREMNFFPSVTEIEKGDTVTWKNLEMGVAHTVTAWGGELFDEMLMNCSYFQDGVGICGGQPKPAFSYTFEEFGTYDYNCKLHNWMSGVVYVDQSIPDSPQNIPSGKTIIKTDFSSYKKGDMIKISGIIPYHDGWKHNTVQLIIQIFDPKNNLVAVSQFFPNEDRTYSASINSGSSMWKFEGDYIIRTSYADEVASTTFALDIPGAPFDPPSPAPPTQSKIPTVLTLNTLPSTVIAGETLRFSGSLKTTDGIPVANEKIFFRNGVNELGSLNTHEDGTFSGTREMHQIGNDYMIFAFFYGGSSNFETAKSQTYSLKVFPAGFPEPVTPATPEPTQPDDIPYAGIAGLVIIVVIIAGIVIGIKGARKKRSIQYASPAAPTGGSGQQQTWQQAPPKKKRKIGIRNPKPQIQPQGIDDYSGLDLDPLYCANVSCLSEHLKTKANGQKYCTKCGWNK